MYYLHIVVFYFIIIYYISFSYEEKIVNSFAELNKVSKSASKKYPIHIWIEIRFNVLFCRSVTTFQA